MHTLHSIGNCLPEKRAPDLHHQGLNSKKTSSKQLCTFYMHTQKQHDGVELGNCAILTTQKGLKSY